MKNAAVVLSSLSLVGVIILFVLFFSHKKEGGITGVPAATTAATGGSLRIAYVNVDTLESKYERMKVKTEEFKKRQEQMETELQRSYQQMQSDAAEVQKKAQAGTLTQSEYQAAEKRLSQMQQSFQTRKESLTDQLLKDKDDFNKDLKERLDAFLVEYNKVHHFDYVFYYSSGVSSLLYVNKDLEITKDVVEGMNERAKSEDKKKN